MPLIYYLSSATASAVDSCVRAIGGLVPPICHHLCSRTSPAGPARRFAITFARATCEFFQIFLKIDQAWWPKIDEMVLGNTPITIARTFWVFCISYKLIKESGQSLQISESQKRRFWTWKFFDDLQNFLTPGLERFLMPGLQNFNAWASFFTDFLKTD